MMIRLLSVIAMGAVLSACGATDPKPVQPTQLTTSASPQIIIENENLSDADKARLQGQLANAMNREVARLNTPTTITNISRVHDYEQVVDGKTYLFIDFYTADGKMYRTRQTPDKVTQAQRQKLRQLKGATFNTVVPISGNSNHFFVAGLTKPVF